MSEFLVASRLQRHDVHKLHGLGNDFLVWFRPSMSTDAEQAARRWCDRHTGIGADGLIIAIDDRVAPTFVLFNADGTRAEVSGNGLRCFGHALAARRGLDSLSMIAVTDAGDRALEVHDALSMQARVSVGMGAPTPGPALPEADLTDIIDFRRLDTVDLGNPHIVVEVRSLDGIDIAAVGPAIEAYFLPTGINVHVAQPTERGARILIWERGVGVTEACGSGACAVAALAALRRPDQRTFTIEMPGGSAEVDAADELTLRAPSTYVAAIDIEGS